MSVISSPVPTQAIAATGVDAVELDQEHGSIDFGGLFGRPLHLARCAKIETPTLDLLTALAAQAVATGADRGAPHQE